MNLAIVGLLIVGQAFAAPEHVRLRRDAPILPQWQVPVRGFDGGEVIIPFGGEGGFGDISESRSFSYSGDVAHDEYGVPHEDYGPPPVPHDEYGPPPTVREEPVVTEHYCPEEDIVPPFAPAPPPPAALPLPVPIYREEVKPVIPHEEYGPPELPHEEYGPPPIPHEEYGPPEVPHEEYGPLPIIPAPPAFIENPYPVRIVPVTTTTEVPTTVYYAPYPAPTTLPPTVRYAPYPAPTTLPPPPPPTYAPPPPPPPFVPAPYPARIIPIEPVTEAPTTVYYAPYPAPTTLPPVIYTEPPTIPPPLKVAPYPAKQESSYGSSSGVGASESGFGGSGDSGYKEVPATAIRAPLHHGSLREVKSIKLVSPKLIFKKKLVSFPKLLLAKKLLKFGR